MLGSDTSVIIPSSNGNGAGQTEEEGEEGREASEDDHADAAAPGILGAGEAVLYVSAEESVEQVGRMAAAFPLKALCDMASSSSRRLWIAQHACVLSRAAIPSVKCQGSTVRC